MSSDAGPVAGSQAPVVSKAHRLLSVGTRDVMARILVAYHSRTGHTQHMAEAIAEGASQVQGAVAEARPIAGLGSADLIDYEAVVLGSATPSSLYQRKRVKLGWKTIPSIVCGRSQTTCVQPLGSM